MLENAQVLRVRNQGETAAFDLLTAMRGDAAAAERFLARFASLPAAEIALLLLAMWGISTLLPAADALTFLTAGLLGTVGLWIADRTGFRPALDPGVSNRQRYWIPLLVGGAILSAYVLITGAPLLWTRDGVPVCTAVGAQYSPCVVPDGQGGAFVVWLDGRGLLSLRDVYAQRLTAGGAVAAGWPADGALIWNHSTPDHLVACGDGSGGFFVAWDTGRRYGSGIRTSTVIGGKRGKTSTRAKPATEPEEDPGE